MLCSRNCKRKLRPYDVSHNPGDCGSSDGKKQFPPMSSLTLDGAHYFSLCMQYCVYIQVAECYIKIQLVSNLHLMTAHDIQ